MLIVLLIVALGLFLLWSALAAPETTVTITDEDAPQPDDAHFFPDPVAHRIAAELHAARWMARR